MKILAIETSSKVCSVALLENDKIIIKKDIFNELTHSQKLMPLISDILQEKNISLDEINLLSCSIGPGSFTGIRIGVATIKAFADVKNIPCTGVNSLEGLAYNISNEGLVCAMIDARNDNVYFGLYDHFDNSYKLLEPLKADHIDNIISILKKYTSPILFVGDGAVAQKDILKNTFSNCEFAEGDLNLANSASIGSAAYAHYLKGEFGDSNSVSPLYLRKSQAERALDEKNNKKE